MTILANSRYEGVDITGLKQADGTIKAFLHNRTPIKQDEIGTDFIVREIKSQEDLDLLSFQIGGKARLFWILADINEIVDPHEKITPGTRLKIPSSLFLSNR